METLKVILVWLSGKKSIIAGIITTTSAYLAAQGMITPEFAIYINGITLLVFGSASVATGQIVYKKG
jgi:hypothetical protein